MSEQDQQAHDRIADVMARRGREARAPEDFDERLWAAIDAPPVRGRSRVYAVAAVVALAAAVVLAWSLWPRDDRSAPADTLAVWVRAGDGAPSRSTTAAPGDVLEVTGQGGDADVVELRLYRDNVLVLACSDHPPCVRAGSQIRAAFPLATRGSYDVALIRAATALSPPQGEQDRDLAAAIEAGAEVTTSRVDVQ